MKNYFDEINIVNLYKQGKTQNEIAKIYNTYNTSIRRILLRNNIIPRNPKKIGEDRRLVKGNPFLNSPHKDYWIGLLATDGCVQKKESIVIALSEKDKELLELFQEFLGGNVNITKDSKNILRIAFRNKEILNYLIDIGIKPQKSLNLNLQTPLSFDMLRGIIDGDGSVHKSNNSISIYSSSVSFIFQINNFLTCRGFQTKLHVSMKNRKNPFYSISIFGKKQIEAIYNFLYYSEDLPCLTRKKQLIFNKINGTGNG